MNKSDNFPIYTCVEGKLANGTQSVRATIIRALRLISVGCLFLPLSSAPYFITCVMY